MPNKTKNKQKVGSIFVEHFDYICSSPSLSCLVADLFFVFCCLRESSLNCKKRILNFSLMLFILFYMNLVSIMGQNNLINWKSRIFFVWEKCSLHREDAVLMSTIFCIHIYFRVKAIQRLAFMLCCGVFLSLIVFEKGPITSD